MEQRSVDWPLLEPNAPPPVMFDGAAPFDLGVLLSAREELLACEGRDTMLKRAVEIARDRIGFTRVAIFLRDDGKGLMCGTWGTDLAGRTVDERGITFQLSHDDLEFRERLARQGVYWTVVNNAPIVAHTLSQTRVVGRGWVCCTPIRIGFRIVGIMFNDAGLTGAGVDDAKQARGALLCSLLGTVLDHSRSPADASVSNSASPRSAAVARAAQMLAEDPALTSQALGARLRMSSSRVARRFKAEMGMSLVEYKNRLRLQRFFELMDDTNDNLLEAALMAGFGSYAQFHRVFLARQGMTPGKFLRSRGCRQK